jgi:hypothetical protein
MQPSINAVKEVFLKELKLLTVRARTKDAALFDLWTQNLL